MNHRLGITALVLVLCASAASHLACARQPTEPTTDLVVFVVVDTLRRDHLSVFGYERNTSPFLDRLSSQSLFLSNMVVHASQTVPSISSIITSSLPSVHGIQFYARGQNFGSSAPKAPVLRSELRTMAEHFRDDGFYTIGYVTNPWLRADLGFDQGFEEYVLIPCFSHRRPGCDGRDLIERAKQSIGARDTRKVFLYLHFMDVHHPYGPTENVPRLFRPEQGSYVYRDGLVPDLAADDLEFTKALYDERIAHVDELLSDLMGFVVRHNLTDRTALVVTSDHGDEFYEHGGLGHGTTLPNELTNSFAILWGPGVFQAQEVDRYLPALDLLPTLLEALRIPPDPGLQGHSQWRSERPDGTTDDRPIVSELKRFSDSPCTAWARRGTSACTNAGGPMQAYSMDLRERALLDSDAGMKAADVAVKYRVSGSWVRLLKQRRRETGDVAPRVQRHGRRRMLEPHLHTLAALIAEQPDRTVAELKDALGPPASLATIWRAVAALDVTVKKNGPALRTRST